MHVRGSILRHFRGLAVWLAALLFASALETRADETTPPAGGYFGTFEGHYLDNFGEKTRWAESVPPAIHFNILPEWGGGGRVGLGYRSTAGWDVVALGAADWLYSGNQQAVVTPPLGLAVTSPSPAFRLFLGSPASAETDATLAYSYVDLEGGYNLKLGSFFDARLFGGVRYANFDQQIDTTGTSFELAGFQQDSRSEVSYWGVGPRVGASGRLRICESPFYLVSSVSGSVLWGDQRVRDRESSSVGFALNAFNFQTTNYTSRTAYNGEGELGVLYDISPVLQGLDVTVGYRVAGWFGVNDTRTGVSFFPQFASGESHANVVTQGTFLRINVRY